MDSNSLLLNTLLNSSAIIMINSKSAKIKIMRIKGKVHSLTSKYITSYRISGRENKKSKTLQLLFLQMGILLGSGNLGLGIPIFRLLGYLSLRDHVPNGEGILGRSITSWRKALFTHTCSSRGPNINGKILGVGNLLKRR